MEINKQEYYNQYKNIYTKCINEGIVFPVLLSEIYLPKEFQFSSDEIYDFKKNISKKNQLKQLEYSRNMRKLERDIISKYEDWNDKNSEKCEKELRKLYIDELNDFINKYPKFKTIING